MQKKSKNKRGGGDQRFVNVFSYWKIQTSMLKFKRSKFDFNLLFYFSNFYFCI